MTPDRDPPLPPDAPHAQRCLAPGWWLLPAAFAGAVFWVAILLLLF